MMLAYTPFLDPLDLHALWWLTMAPLALGISIVYKAIRVGDLRHYWRGVLVMTLQVLLGMVALAAGTFVVVELIAYGVG